MNRLQGNLKKIVASALTVAMVATLPITANASTTSEVYTAPVEYYRSHVITDPNQGMAGCMENYFRYNTTGDMNTVLTSVSEVAHSSMALSYNNDFGPIVMAYGTFTDNDGSVKNVYFITLEGTDNDNKENHIGFDTDLMVGFQNSNNPYALSVKNAILRSIPKDSNLMFFGHSLGGMVCQQVIAFDEIKANYNVLYTVTCGSPVIGGSNREGVITRLGDSSDPIPYLSVTGKFVSQIWGLNREDGGYTKGLWSWSEGWKAHTTSYNRDDVWGSYDVTGKKGGHAKLVLDPETIVLAKAPRAK